MSTERCLSRLKRRAPWPATPPRRDAKLSDDELDRVHALVTTAAGAAEAA